MACEFSGTVRDAFAARGWDAWSCDLLPSEQPGAHFQGDVRLLLDGWQPVEFTADCDPEGDGWCQKRDVDPCECPCLGPTQDDVEYREIDGVLFGRRGSWDLMIAHPPCTYLSVSGLHWNKRRPERAAQTEDALAFVQTLLDAPIPRIALENPVGCISSRIRKPSQIIQPHHFGADASKATCLWLKGIPPLVPTQRVAPRIVDGRQRWANQTDSGQNRLGPSADRWALRSMTYPGIAIAMAQQWTAAIERATAKEA